MKRLEETTVELVKIQSSDAWEFYRIAHNGEVEKFVASLFPEDIEEANIIIEMLMDGSNYISYKIQNSKGEFVGVIHGEKHVNGMIDVSYFIGKEFRGHGYCTVAVSKFEKKLKEQNFKGMQFVIDQKNRKSKKVMKRLKIPMDHEYLQRFLIYKKIF